MKEYTYENYLITTDRCILFAEEVGARERKGKEPFPSDVIVDVNKRAHRTQPTHVFSRKILRGVIKAMPRKGKTDCVKMLGMQFRVEYLKKILEHLKKKGVEEIGCFTYNNALFLIEEDFYIVLMRCVQQGINFTETTYKPFTL